MVAGARRYYSHVVSGRIGGYKNNESYYSRSLPHNPDFVVVVFQWSHQLYAQHQLGTTWLALLLCAHCRIHHKVRGGSAASTAKFLQSTKAKRRKFAKNTHINCHVLYTCTHIVHTYYAISCISNYSCALGQGMILCECVLYTTCCQRQ